MNEPMRLETWLWGRLVSDPTLMGWVGNRVWAYHAPPDATLPCVVFQQQSARDVRGVGSARIMVDTLYVVRGVTEERSFGGLLVNIADRIDAVLHGASGTVADGVVLHVVREEPFTLAEEQNGKQYRHLGGLYRCWVQAA